MLSAGQQMKDSAAHTGDVLGAKYDKNKAEVKEHVKSGPQAAQATAEKEAAKSQEKASKSAAKGHAEDVSLPNHCACAYA